MGDGRSIDLSMPLGSERESWQSNTASPSLNFDAQHRSIDGGAPPRQHGISLSQMQTSDGALHSTPYVLDVYWPLPC